ncbi:hypothetical protein BDQ17DRAFT_1426102 [Cyathus striatus]|nr:hypothetical protein BDQ17DRAFT_1426102 [Cyathus striatus]
MFSLISAGYRCKYIWLVFSYIYTTELIVYQLIILAADIASDLYLAALPLYRLWRLRMPSPQRRLIRLVFSTSLLTLVVVFILLIYSYGRIFEGPGSTFVWLMIVRIEEAICIVANNLTVLLSWGYKVFFGDADLDEEYTKYDTPRSWEHSGRSAV